MSHNKALLSESLATLALRKARRYVLAIHMKYIVIMFLMITSGNLIAADDYKCLITNAIEPNQQGQIDEIGDKSVIGQMFTVDRITGVMSGVLKNNYINSPVVVDYGSVENSFKVVTIMKNNITSNIHALTIQEFIKGSKKPFIYLHDATAFYGVCTHF
jgi:hypothetical protein